MRTSVDGRQTNNLLLATIGELKVQQARPCTDEQLLHLDSAASKPLLGIFSANAVAVVRLFVLFVVVRPLFRVLSLTFALNQSRRHCHLCRDLSLAFPLSLVRQLATSKRGSRSLLPQSRSTGLLDFHLQSPGNESVRIIKANTLRHCFRRHLDC
jgi:hypothetical protein